MKRNKEEAVIILRKLKAEKDLFDVKRKKIRSENNSHFARLNTNYLNRVSYYTKQYDDIMKEV